MKRHHLYTTCSKCPPPARTEILDVDELRRCIKKEWTVWITPFIERAFGHVAPASRCLWLWWRQTFWAYDEQMMWLTTRLMITETITASRVCNRLPTEEICTKTTVLFSTWKESVYFAQLFVTVLEEALVKPSKESDNGFSIWCYGTHSIHSQQTHNTTQH